MTEVNNLDNIAQQVNNNNTDTSQNNDNDQQNNNQNNNSNSKQVVLGCDINQNDAQYQQTVAGIIEQAGYTVEKLEIEPNAFATYSYDPKAKGKLGIYLIAAGTYSIGDATYGNTYFDYNYFGIRPECSPNWDVSDFDTKPIGSDPDTQGGVTDKIAGKSFKEINEIVKDRSMCVTGKDATEMGNNLVAAMGGQAPGGGASSGGGGAVLIPDKTFYGLIKQIIGAIDGMFIVSNNMAYLLSFKDFYEYRNQFDEFIPKIEKNDVLRDTLIKNWSTDACYNAVEVTYADGIIKYKNDVLVKQYGENVFYYEFPEDDEETAKAKADALLGAHIRDYSTNIQLSVFYNPNINEGSWVKVNKSITQISGKTRKEIEEEKIKAQGNKIETKHKGITVTNLIEKTITENNITKTIQSITDEEGNKFDIEVEDNEYELFFVQSYTCRWDENNSLIMDLELKYGPDTPEDPINATVGTGGGVSSGGTGTVGGQAADINAFVKQCLGSSVKQDRATAEKLYKCLQGLIVYSFYECSNYSTPSQCYQHAKELNCADTSRLVTACYKAAGFQCQCVWGPGHFWNELTIGGEVITVDLSSGQTGVSPTKPMGEKLQAGGTKQEDNGDNPSC